MTLSLNKHLKVLEDMHDHRERNMLHSAATVKRNGRHIPGINPYRFATFFRKGLETDN